MHVLEALVFQLNAVFRGSGWHGPTLLGALRGVTPREALAKPRGCAHGLWDQLLHATCWKYTILVRLGEAQPHTFPRTPSNWPRTPSARTTAGELTKLWKADLRPARTTHATLVRAVAQLDPAGLNEIPPGGKRAEPEPFLREALERRRRVFGEDDPDTLQSITNLGGLMRAQGRLAEAEAYGREALEKYRRALGDQHADTLQAIGSVANALLAQGRGGEALLLLEPAEGAARKAFTGPSTPRLATILSAMGRARLAANDDPARFEPA
ncbi:MAG: tetratricopeptide repeat protein [Planctomycetota bacterium]|nr:tetratricopeptide repeat protein [Planctomycetota bacterium]